MALPSLAEGVDHKLDEHENTLNSLADRLRELMARKQVGIDVRATAILNRIVQARDAVEVDKLMDELMVRVGELIAEHTGDTSELNHLRVLTGPRKRGVFAVSASTRSEDFGESLSLPSRSFMRL